MGRGLRPLSTRAQEYLETLFQRAFFAWLVVGGDMHLKNLALLKTAEPKARRFSEVRFAPLYDAVTTRVFPGLQHDRMVLKLNGKDDRLGPEDFRRLAATLGIAAGRATEILSATAFAVAVAALNLELPPLQWNAEAQHARETVTAIARDRAEAFF